MALVLSFASYGEGTCATQPVDGVVVVSDNSLTSIANSAYSNCPGLESVVITSNSVTQIGQNAFESNPSLISLNVSSNSVTIIGADVTIFCPSLMWAVIPDSIVTIDRRAFPTCLGYGLTVAGIDRPRGLVQCVSCTNQSTLTIPDSVVGIGWFTFQNCHDIVSVVLPDSLTLIDSRAFLLTTSLASVEVPNSVTWIGAMTFRRCDSLVSVVIGNSVTFIDYEAFREASRLVSIVLPDSLLSFGTRVFLGCTSLIEIDIPDSVRFLTYRAFENCASLTSVVIGNAVTYIGFDVFYSCRSLTSVVMGNNLLDIGTGAFRACTSLLSVVMGDRVNSIASGAFQDCSSLVNITLSNTVTSLSEAVFASCSSLSSLVIPNSVTLIAIAAFAHTNISSIRIPDTVTSLDPKAFEGCPLALGTPVAQTTDPEFPEAVNWGARSMWALNRTYFLNAVDISRINMSLPTRVQVNTSLLTYSIVRAQGGPRLLVDATTGMVQLTPQVLSNTTATVYAMLPGYRDLAIGTITFDVRIEDVLNPNAAGPGGANCSNGGVPIDTYDGTSEFDLYFSCDCSTTGFVGSTCSDVISLVVDTPVAQRPQPGVVNALTWEQRSRWSIGRSYFLKPVNINNMSLSTGTPVNISLVRYSISPAPAGLLIDPTTGFAQLTPQSRSNTTAFVYAMYSGYPNLKIGDITFDIRIEDVFNANARGPSGANCSNRGVPIDTYDGTSEFDLSYMCDCSATGYTGSNCDQETWLRLRPDSLEQYVPAGASNSSFEFVDGSLPGANLMRTLWAVNTTYRIAPLKFRNLMQPQGGYTDANSSANLSITYALQWITSTSPRGFFLDSTTGEMLVEIPDQGGNHTAQVMAESSGTRAALVYTISLEFLPVDTSNESNGPNNRDCAGGVEERVDEIEFDNMYVHGPIPICKQSWCEHCSSLHPRVALE